MEKKTFALVIAGASGIVGLEAQITKLNNDIAATGLPITIKNYETLQDAVRDGADLSLCTQAGNQEDYFKKLADSMQTLAFPEASAKMVQVEREENLFRKEQNKLRSRFHSRKK